MELLQLNAVMPLSGGQGGLSVNPITTRGADYAHHNTASPPGFENPAAYLDSTTCNCKHEKLELKFEQM